MPAVLDREIVVMRWSSNSDPVAPEQGLVICPYGLGIFDTFVTDSDRIDAARIQELAAAVQRWRPSSEFIIIEVRP